MLTYVIRSSIVLLLFVNIAHAGSYVCWDSESKQVTEVYKSVDGAAFGIIRPNTGTFLQENCKSVTNDEIEGVNKYYKYEDNKIIEMTKNEKDTIDAPSKQATIDRELNRQSARTKLKGLGLTDEEIDALISN